MATPLTDATTRCPACYEQIVSEDLDVHLRGFHGWSEPLIAAAAAAGGAAPLDVRTLAARVRGQLVAALGAAELAERTALTWSDLIGRHAEQAEIAYRGGPPAPDHLWLPQDHEAALDRCAELHQLAQAARLALETWEARVEERGAPRREP